MQIMSRSSSIISIFGQDRRATCVFLFEAGGAGSLKSKSFCMKPNKSFLPRSTRRMVIKPYHVAADMNEAKVWLLLALCAWAVLALSFWVKT